MKYIFNIALILFIFASCKKDEPYAEVGITEVDIVFASPVADETINGSQEVSIEARIDANAMMSGYRITISNSKTGEIMERLDDLYEQTQYIVHHHWYPSPSETISITIDLEALDKNMQTLDAGSIQITCTP